MRYGSRWWLLGYAVIAMGFGVMDTIAQDEAKQKTKGEDGYRKYATTHDLETDDGVYLAATLWLPEKSTNETPVVMLLHLHERSQKDWFPFAYELCENGMAAITFDFRGHGDSKSVTENYKSPSSKKGSQRTKSKKVDKQAEKKRPERIDLAREYRSGEDYTSFTEDLETVKRFLAKQNNDSKINLRRLGMVTASDMATVVALRWLKNREFKFASGGFDTEKADISALVMVSPSLKFKGLTAETELGKGSEELPIMILAPDIGRAYPEAERVANRFRVYPIDAKKSNARADSVLVKFETQKASAKDDPAKFSATDFLNRPAYRDVRQQVIGYFEHRLIRKKGLTWKRREIADRTTGGFGTEK